MTFTKDIQNIYKQHQNTDEAYKMEEYMRYHFHFLGIKAKMRKDLIKPLIASQKIELQEHIRRITDELFDLKHREYHYTAIDLYAKFLKKKYRENDIDQITFLLTTHSWWDSVDAIAKHILGNYLLQFPAQQPKVIKFYSDSQNMWLNRSAIIFQLGYKEKTNREVLFRECKKHADSEEFFIQKAIGWALREYGKVHPKAVLDFVAKTSLQPLSKHEAIRRLM